MTDHELLERESKRFAGNVGVCRHESPKVNTAYRCDICRKTFYYQEEIFNLTYTIELIVAELKRIKRWDGLIKWMGMQALAKWADSKNLGTEVEAAYPDSVWGWLGDEGIINADILTTPLYFMQAASAYIEEVG